MGVPQLMTLLEPNIVWEHAVGQSPVSGREVQATYATGALALRFWAGVVG
jgi:hypothetical protein